MRLLTRRAGICGVLPCSDGRPIAATLVVPTLCLCGLIAFVSGGAAQGTCDSPESIERMNGDQLERVSHIEGEDAILFIALDPVWSAPEIQDEDYQGYRDEHFIAAIRDMRDALLEARIDEVVIWRLSRPSGMGVAVPFRDGCAVSLYGEPDFANKLETMSEAFEAISANGLEHPSVRRIIEELLMKSRYGPFYEDRMADAVIDNLRLAMDSSGYSKPDSHGRGD
jgi:hypothetical protein